RAWGARSRGARQALATRALALVQAALLGRAHGRVDARRGRVDGRATPSRRLTDAVRPAARPYPDAHRLPRLPASHPNPRSTLARWSATGGITRCWASRAGGAATARRAATLP